MPVKPEKNILKGDELLFNTDLGGIGKVYYDCMKSHGQKIAQIDSKSGKADTFDKLLKRCVRTAIEMKKRGIKKDDTISICSYNHSNVCVPLIAAHFIGAIPCPLDPSLSPSDTTYLLKLVKPKIVFTSDEFLIKTAAKDAGIDIKLVVFGESKETTTFDEFLQQQENEMEFLPVTINNPNETALVLFTSGTSGFPKGICVSHSQLLYDSPLNGSGPNDDPNEDQIKWSKSTYDAGKMIYLSYSSLYWFSGCYAIWAFTLMGQARIICSEFDVKELWHLIDKYKVTTILLGGTQLAYFVKSEKPQNVDTTCLNMILTSGSLVPKNFLLSLRKLLPNTNIFQVYGQTETGGITGFSLERNLHMRYCLEKPDSVGLPTKGKIYKIVDPETEETLGPNQPGELRIKSDYIMNGYYKMDSSDCYDKDGWFKTGDILYYDEDQCFFFIDRIKEIFKFRGFQVQPAIIEAELLQHPAVKEAVVFGKPHEVDGDHALGVIILHKNAKNASIEEIQKFVDERLNDDSKKLRGGLKIMEDFPRTPSAKVNRRKLKQMVLGEYL